MKFIFINKQFRFMTDYTGFSGFLNKKNVLQNLRYSFVTFSIILRCSSLVPPLISRLLLVRSSFVLRLIFDRQSKDERRKNEERTKNEREPNEERTRTERRTNENRTKNEREAIENRTRNYRFGLKCILYITCSIA